MIIVTLPPLAGKAMKISGLRFNQATWCQFMVMGPGQVRWGTNKEQLENGPAVGISYGIPQANGDPILNLMWKGEVWAISDTPGTPVQFIDSAHDFQSQFGLGGFRQ